MIQEAGDLFVDFFFNLLLRLLYQIFIGNLKPALDKKVFFVNSDALLPIGSLFKDPGPFRDLFAKLGPYWVFISLKRS